MKYLHLVSAILSHYAVFFVVGMGALAYLFPPICDWVSGTSAMVIIAIIMLSMGMTLSLNDFKILAKRPWQILLGTVAQFSIMPIVAWGLSKIFSLEPAVAMGLLIVGSCPGGVSSNIMSYLAKGDVAFSVGMTTVNTILSPIMTPLLLLWFSGQNVQVDAWGIFYSIVQIVLIPVIVGVTLNIVLGKYSTYKETLKLMPAVSVVSLAFIVGGIMCHQGIMFIQSGKPLNVILIMCGAIMLHNALGYLMGYVLAKFSRLDRAKCRTLSIEVGCQNAGMGTQLAIKHFPTMPEAAIASAFACVYHSVSGVLLANLFALYDVYRNKKAPTNAKEYKA